MLLINNVANGNELFVTLTDGDFMDPEKKAFMGLYLLFRAFSFSQLQPPLMVSLTLTGVVESRVLLLVQV